MRVKTGIGRCEYCGKEFSYRRRKDGKGYIETKYCSDVCSKAKLEQDNMENIKSKIYGWGTCQYCGKQFEKEKKLSGRGYKERKFCSVECENKHHAEISKQRYGYGTCIICGKHFERKLTKDYYSQSQFCSEECKNVYADRKYPSRIVYCAYCGKRTPLIYYGSKKGSYINVKFCNKECETKYLNEIYGRKHCKQCGKEFERPYYIDKNGYREYKRGFKYDFCETCRQNLPRSSEAEQKFAVLLQENGINYDLQEFNLENSYYDFHITGYNILVDVNPSFTHTIKESFMGPGKDKYYHYNRLELAARYGYLYLCIWDWSNTQNIVDIIKQQIQRDIKYTLKEHNQPNLLYYENHANTLVLKENIKIDAKYYDYLPVYDCGSYKYNEIDYIFDAEQGQIL